MLAGKGRHAIPIFVMSFRGSFAVFKADILLGAATNKTDEEAKASPHSEKATAGKSAMSFSHLLS
jgi:hypothetical protein